MFTYFILYFFIISHFLVLFLFFVARSSVLFSSASFSAFLAFLPSIAVTLDLDHDPGELQQPNTVDPVIVKSKASCYLAPGSRWITPGRASTTPSVQYSMEACRVLILSSKKQNSLGNRPGKQKTSFTGKFIVSRSSSRSVLICARKRRHERQTRHYTSPPGTPPRLPTPRLASRPSSTTRL